MSKVLADGYALVLDRFEEYHFINTDGDIVFDNEHGYEWATSYSNGLAFIIDYDFETRTDYEGYIDKEGNLIYRYDIEGWPYIDAYFDVHY
ncbi:hypothetical protein AB685_23480 [Bacillus sp. LL01]|uniref:hypothetical protein n=1 Tax=Bacillus sp. LL01 TaxID=1665556 RepID=UPI00064D6636|nr:hypothetical protein [Bacillus sp. LL01]KMJ56143.1 hypothetical protein AB685_23480 [Bacillus sp. LL01]